MSWYLVLDRLFSRRAADESPCTGRPLSIRGGNRDDAGPQVPPPSAWDSTPITPEPWIDWKRHGRVVKIVAQILFILLAIWFRYRVRQR